MTQTMDLIFEQQQMRARQLKARGLIKPDANEILAGSGSALFIPSSQKKFWKQVIKLGKNDCWIWDGVIGTHERGVFTVNGQQMPAYRYVYIITRGFIRKGFHVHHTCQNGHCVNPNHLQALSPEDHRDRHMVLKINKLIEAKKTLDCFEDILHSTYTMKKGSKPKQSNKTWRPTPSDRQLLRDLQAKTGIVAEVELIRMGLRKLAQAEGIGQ